MSVMAASLKTSKMAIVSAVLSLLQVFLFGAAKLQVLPLAITQLAIIAIATLVIALIAYLRIRRSAGTLKGKGLAIFSLIISSFPILFLLALLFAIIKMPR